MEHILGCHGEWLYLIQAAAALPLVGVWLKAYVLPTLRLYQHSSSPSGGKDTPCT